MQEVRTPSNEMNIPKVLPVKCVVCNGYGTVLRDKIQCHGCKGRGYILVRNGLWDEYLEEKAKREGRGE